MAVNKVPYLEHLKQFGLRESALIGRVAQTAADAIEEQAEQIDALSEEVHSSIGAKSYVKTFADLEWSDGTITILESEHKLKFTNGDVLSKVYMLSNGVYTNQCLAAMDTVVSISDDKSVILSYDGAPYNGKVVLIG